MVTAVTSLGRSGVADWLIQRLSAIIMTAYLFFIVGYIVTTPELDYAQWQGLFNQLWMRIFSLLTLLSVAAHSWIGLWTVLTDYLNEHLLGGKATVLRLFAQAVLGLVTFAYTLWGIEIIWGF